MSRPSAEIIIEHTDEKKHKTDQILASDGIWAVYYNNNAINVRTRSTLAFVAIKYKNVSFSNKGHAINCAKKLNRQFCSNKFTVVFLSNAETIYSE